MSIEYKGYNIVNEPPYMLKAIKAIGKGSVHLALRGKYTTSAEACLAIDRFLTKQEITDGKKSKSD